MGIQLEQDFSTTNAVGNILRENVAHVAIMIFPLESCRCTRDMASQAYCPKKKDRHDKDVWDSHVLSHHVDDEDDQENHVTLSSFTDGLFLQGLFSRDEVTQL